MAKSSMLGDIPGNRFPLPLQTNASAASNGANARLGQVGPFPFDIRLRAGWWSPTGADSDATSTASYRRLSVYNGGSAGTGTATASRMASLNLTASQASLGAVAFVVDSTVTAASGSILYFSQETVGGAESNGTVLRAGQAQLFYEII
jgi:hypothetical protein